MSSYMKPAVLIERSNLQDVESTFSKLSLINIFKLLAFQYDSRKITFGVNFFNFRVCQFHKFPQFFHSYVSLIRQIIFLSNADLSYSVLEIIVLNEARVQINVFLLESSLGTHLNNSFRRFLVLAK